MKKKTIKKKEPQVIEIHIYIHQAMPNTYPPIYVPNYPGGAGGTGDNPFNHPIVTC